MRALAFLSFLVVIIAGCGPLSRPMVLRLDPDTQRSIDEAWLCMLTPPDRSVRTLLLDTILEGQMHEYGVDSLRFVSEKEIGDALVVMEVNYERADPNADEFIFTYVDRDGFEIRREQYSRHEVEGRLEFFYGPGFTYGPAAFNDERPKLSREKRENLDRERQSRREEIWALRKPIAPDTNADADPE